MANTAHVELRVSNWGPLNLVCKEMPSRPGIYFLGAPFNIRYPRGISRIFYVGSSMDLKRRLGSHLGTVSRGNTLVRCFLSRGEEILATCLIHNTNDVDEIRALEEAAFFGFGAQYGMVPHGNRVPPQPEDLLKYRFSATIKESDVNGETLTEKEIAKRYALEIQEDYGFSTGTAMTFYLDSETVEESKGTRIGNINFISKSAS